MKLTHLTPNAKYVIGMALYGVVTLLIVLLTEYTDVRFGIAGFFFLGFISFALALYAATRSKKVITAMLIAALAFAPASTTRADSGEIDPHYSEAVACVTLIVGGIIIWGLWKVCKRLLPPPPKTPPPPNGTNDELVASITLNSGNAPQLKMPDASLCIATDWQMAVISFQSSTNLSDWQDAYTITNWFSGNRVVSLCASNGVPLQTNFVAVGFTNDTVFSDFSAVMPSKETSAFKAWRAVQTQ